MDGIGGTRSTYSLYARRLKEKENQFGGA